MVKSCIGDEHCHATGTAGGGGGIICVLQTEFSSLFFFSDQSFRKYFPLEANSSYPVHMDNKFVYVGKYVLSFSILNKLFISLNKHGRFHYFIFSFTMRSTP